MRIMVIGAYGLLGGYITARLRADGCAVLGVGRDIDAAKRRFPTVEWVRADLRKMLVGDWLALLEGVDAVVNCAGALQDSGRDDLEAVHLHAVVALAEACQQAGVRRLVHISAAGIEQTDSRFGRTKQAAEAALKSTDLDWIILRPGLVLAPAAYGGSALLRGLAGFPGFIPALHPGSLIQTVAVEDVAEAASRCVRPDGPKRVTCDLVASEPIALHAILLELRGWLGLPPARVVGMPGWIGRLTALSADGLAWLGWRSAMRSSALKQLSTGVRGNSDAAEQLDFQPRELAETFAAWPSGVQERWFARLYFAKPLALTTLAIFWAISGGIGMAQRDEAARLLTDAGLNATAADTCVLVGSAADLALAVLVCCRRTAPLALKGMVALTLAYLAAASIWTPHLWADPLGPLVKSIPAAVLALVALAMMEER
jgi:uncharacterized protein YbjT (DUF2867 family)